MFNVVLVEPEIPANTGNVGRTCVLTGTRLHLVGPIGFDLSDKSIRRAGLAYWQSLDLHVYESWNEFVRVNFAAGLEGVHLLTKAGDREYAQSTYADGDWLVFGKESAGLNKELIDANPHLCERIPMLSDHALLNERDWRSTYERLHPELRRDICGNFVDERAGWITSLNLSNAVAIVLYEALRQQGFSSLNTSPVPER